MKTLQQPRRNYLAYDPPEPFIMDWVVFDKTGEQINCTATGFYDAHLNELMEVTLLDGHKNDITLLFVTDEELEEMIQHYHHKF